MSSIYRKCGNCNEYSILKSEPKWKRICKKCYIEFKNKIYCLECRKIKQKFKEDVQICKECWCEDEERVKNNCLIDISSL